MTQSPTEDDKEAVSAALNPAIPNVARMYDFMLGGKENYASDRAAVASLIQCSATFAIQPASSPTRQSAN